VGGQNIERREALRVIGLASVAAGFPGFRQWAFACGHNVSSAAPPTERGPYKPLFFSKPQYEILSSIAEMIIPEEGTPGAREAGVPEFIDFMVANRAPVTPEREIRCTQDALEEGNRVQTRFVTGLDWIDARSYSEFGNGFLSCTSQQRNALLEELAYKTKYKPATEDGRAFFNLMRDYTVIGYYTSKIGLRALDYPGLQTSWPSMPGCPHPDDPEHSHLSQPKDPRDAVQKAQQ
jgi:hypothetical protein